MTILPPSYANCLEILAALTSWSPKGLSVPVWGFLLYLLKIIVFLDVTPCLLLEVYHPVGGMAPSIFRVEDYVVWKKTSGLLPIFYQHLASSRHALSILFFYPLISCHLLPSSSVPPILSSPLFLYYNNHAVQTLTQIPVLPPNHARPAFTCCLLHNPWLCYPYLTSLTIFCHATYSSVIVIEVGSSSKMVVKWLLPSTFIRTHRSYWYWYFI